MLLPLRETYEELVRDFVWDIPQDFNIGRAVSDAGRARAGSGLPRTFQSGWRAWQSDLPTVGRPVFPVCRSAGFSGVTRGSRVAILLPQGFETVIAHVAAYKIGAVALPLALLFGADAIEYRLNDSGAAAVVTNRFGFSKLQDIGGALPALKHVILTGDAGEGALSFERLIADHAPLEAQAATGPDDPALMIYTSGTTGPPKGALHGHRVLPGHMPGIQFAHPDLGQAGDKMWTPADWAWAGGLLNCLLPALLLGVPVVSSPGQKFDPDMAFRIMAEMGVRNAFIPPTALRLLRPVDNPLSRYDLKLRTIGSAGESLGRETYEWLEPISASPSTSSTVRPNAISCFRRARATASRSRVPWQAGSGSSRRHHRRGGQYPAAWRRGPGCGSAPDPVMFLGYWNNEAATRKKFIGDWMTTGDQGVMDEDGYFEFFGRDDDVITSSGYRIGPGEIEDCLLGHPAVRLAAAVAQAGPCAHRDRQGFCRAQGRLFGDGRTCRANPRLGQAPALDA